MLLVCRARPSFRSRCSLLALAALFAPAAFAETPGPDKTPTFNRDIAPIIFGQCVLCHHPGGVGPFSLTEYRLSLIHISEPTRQAEISYAVFCLKKKKK